MPAPAPPQSPGNRGLYGLQDNNPHPAPTKKLNVPRFVRGQNSAGTQTPSGTPPQHPCPCITSLGGTFDSTLACSLKAPNAMSRNSI
ncbi:hypothetical protein AAFF_G00226950 [Aldrovandia affinis]|uniref:Uncharacterized protein n=1 Tax=Aldrovandia affinis TaxID=143900 RepID=A0AAD7X2A8_9TELE|nr:hypothetical protein AAFF_G00226950 [Aldrovandia affinis]